MPLVEPDVIEVFKSTGQRFAPAVTEFPSMVLVEVTTRCNLTCIHCPSSALLQLPGFAGDIDVALYEKVVDEVAEYPDTYFRPFNGGEPLLRRDMASLIRYAKARGIKRVGITTNGTLLIDRVREELIEAGLDELEVSIDAATAETYAVVRQSPLFDKVVSNTLKYIEEAKAVSPSRKVTVSFVAQSDNLHEKAMFARFWRGKADTVFVREYHQHNDLTSPRLKVVEAPLAVGPRHPCPFVFQRVIVHHDGKVRFCEFDWEAKHPIGDVRHATLKEIWQGEQYRRLRQSHIDGTFEHPYCAACIDWPVVRWSGQ